MLIFLIIMVILLALIFLAAYLCYYLTFAVPKDFHLDPYEIPKGKQYQDIREDIIKTIDGAIHLPYEDVYIMSHDGLKLHARYYAVNPDGPVDILFHGYRSSGLRDFAGGMRLAMEYGCNALLVDQRSHGESEGKCLAFGVLERQDCLTWINYVNQRFGPVSIVLTGLSMGAATVMMASNLPLPENVKGIVADCGYSSPKEIIVKVMKDLKYPPSILYPFVRLGGKLFGHFDVNAITPMDALKDASVPVLMIHGEDDKFVPCEMSRKNYAACNSDKTLVTVPGAGHGISFMIDYARYRDAVETFFKKIQLI